MATSLPVEHCTFFGVCGGGGLGLGGGGGLWMGGGGGGDGSVKATVRIYKCSEQQNQI